MVSVWISQKFRLASRMCEGKFAAGYKISCENWETLIEIPLAVEKFGSVKYIVQ